MIAEQARGEVARLVDELRATAVKAGRRHLVGIVGSPGTGKSTLATELALGLGREACVVVPMDGFHLGNALLEGTELQARKGAIDTFDAGGYVSLLSRLRDQREPVVYAPSFRRDLEEPIAASIAVPQAIPVVITEGNYLLAESTPWNRIRDLLNEVWYVETPQELRQERLIARHVEFGKTPQEAAAWALGSDEANARFIDSTKHRATRHIRWE